MSPELKIVLAQQSFSVGDIKGNTEKIIACAKEAYQAHADLCVFPELALSGYPPEDLLFQADFKQAIQEAFATIIKATESLSELTILFGYPNYVEDKIYNAAAVVTSGKIQKIYYKQQLPNYGVFDEKRYFTSGDECAVFKIKDFNVGLLICEDIWQKGPIENLANFDVDVTIVINSSPFSFDKHQQRLDLLTAAAKSQHFAFIYLNGVNAQDDLIFDGGACYIDANGKVLWQGDFFKKSLYLLQLNKENNHLKLITQEKNIPIPSPEALMYSALVLGVRDYITKNHIKGVILGLSGGIDSALTLAVAVDALGPQRVHAVFMPSRYTAEISTVDAKNQAETMQVELTTINIEPVYQQFLQTLAPVLAGHAADTTEENLQARSRGTILMAVANKFNYVVLNTGNKSEMAMGYCTLYGDLIGGYGVLKDVYKTWVYRLANYRNSISPAIPQRVIDRPPSAELAPNQKDEDSLPPYHVLDAIIERYIEKEQSTAQIIAAGFMPDLVQTIIRKINQNEYKRRQSPPGPKVTHRAFARERRWPITEGFKNFV